MAFRYGAWSLGWITHEERFGLWLNLHRIEARAAAQHFAGFTSAMSGQPSREMFEALADDQQEAEAEYQRFQGHQEIDRQTAENADEF